MVASQIDVDDTDSTVGLFVHEFLHNLGVGHSQKRPGVQYIDIEIFIYFFVI